jgi:Raf kinase inhibitor-like YbhB/YbcL family protein
MPVISRNALQAIALCAAASICCGLGTAGAALKLTSTAFEDGGTIPKLYTCDGSNFSPPLAWSGVTTDTKTLAIICEDPDAPRGTWVHWVLYNIPAGVASLPAGLPLDRVLKVGASQGTNDFQKVGYGGPCPPKGTHRYNFRIYALNCTLELRPGATKQNLQKAMEGHVVGQGQLIGKYGR